MPPPPDRTVDIDTLAAALEAAHGNQATAAKALGIHRSTVCYRVKKSARLAAIIEHAKETQIDIAEDLHWQLCLEKDRLALESFLKAKGKKRGWGVDRQEIGGTDGQQIVIEFVRVGPLEADADRS
jgi:DNA-binding transcriptional regulator YdaS (Cro superfamily)